MLVFLLLVVGAEKYRITKAALLQFIVRSPVNGWPAFILLMAATIVLFFVVLSYLFWLIFKNTKWEYRPRLIDDEYAAHEMLSKSSKDKFRIFAGRYDGKPFFVSVEDRGLVIGPPGTGKTVFLMNQVLRAAENSLSMCLIDTKPELHQVLAQSLMEKGYRVLRINPAKDDPDADHWNPLQELNDQTDIEELCAALLPINTVADRPFVEAQRDWLKAAVFHIKSMEGVSLPMAYDFLSSHADPNKLIEIMSASKNIVALQIANRLAVGLSGSKPDPLILPGLSGCLRSLSYLSLPGVKSAIGHSDFLMKEFGVGYRPVALFLQFEESKLGVLGALMSFLITGILTLLINHSVNRKLVALFLDEIGNIPPLPGLAEKLNTIRSRKIPTWMYFQTAEQIERRYGQGARDVFFAASDLQMVFRLNDDSTRKMISASIGATEVYKISK